MLLQVLRMCLLILVSCSLMDAVNSCREPDNVEDLKIDMYRLMHERFQEDAPYLVIPEYADMVAEQVRGENEAKYGEQFRQLLANSTQRFRVKISEQTRCDSKSMMHELRSNSNASINKLSSCPWHMVLDVDANRVPKSIAMAACTCRECRSLKTGRECPGHTCQEIINKMPVIRRLCYNGTYSYITHIESVPVGCTCMREAGRVSRSNRRNC